MDEYKNYRLILDGTWCTGNIVRQLQHLGADVLQADDDPDTLVVLGILEIDLAFIPGIKSILEIVKE